MICITHLPQVASLAAATHFRIEKRAARGETVAEVERVGGDELVAEIVRMLGGERGDAAASATPASCSRPPDPPPAHRA